MTALSFVGNYADQIFSLEIDTVSGRFLSAASAAKLPAPSYCAVAEGYLIVCSETSSFGDSYGGGLVSFAICDDGSLRELSRVCTQGTYPCHVAFDGESRRVAAANYGDGSFAVCKIGEDGRLSNPHIFAKHRGSGPDKARQDGPHAHQCLFDCDGTLWVVDLGLDAAVQYSLDSETAREIRRLCAPPGSGARHMVTDKTGRYAYVLCEMGSLIAAFDLNSPGDINPEEIYRLADDSPGKTGAAAIRYRGKDGLLLATNRFKDNISLYVTDGTSLTLLDRTSCGKTPRDAEFVPHADLVVAGFQDEDRVALYDISAGKFEIVDEIKLPRPTCFVFV